LSQELHTVGLLLPHVLVGYRWQNIGLSPDDSGSTAMYATSCRNFPNPAGHFHGTVALQNSLSVCTKVLRPIQANLGLSDEFL
jgi:hypothetical protein